MRKDLAELREKLTPRHRRLRQIYKRLLHLADSLPSYIEFKFVDGCSISTDDIFACKEIEDYVLADSKGRLYHFPKTTIAVRLDYNNRKRRLYIPSRGHGAIVTYKHPETETTDVFVARLKCPGDFTWSKELPAAQKIDDALTAVETLYQCYDSDSGVLWRKFRRNIISKSEMMRRNLKPTNKYIISEQESS